MDIWEVARWVSVTLCFGFTWGVWRAVALLYNTLDAAPVIRRRVMRSNLRVVGVWQWTVGLVLVTRGDWVNSISLFIVGLAFIVTPNFMVGGALSPRYGEPPDFSDRRDVERWLRETDRQPGDDLP